MATKADIDRVVKKAIGYSVPSLVDAIFQLDHPVGPPETQREDMEPAKETRVLSAAETR